MNVSNILRNILENGCLTIHDIDESQLICIRAILSMHNSLKIGMVKGGFARVGQDLTSNNSNNPQTH